MGVTDNMRWFALAAALSISACRNADSASTPAGQRYEPGCSFGEKTGAACDALRQGIILDEGGGRINLNVTNCWMPELLAQVAWASSTEATVRYHALLRFTANGPEQSLRPLWGEPLVLEWPLRNALKSAPRELQVSLKRGCGSASLPTEEVRVPLRIADESACRAESWLTGGPPDWCVRAFRGELLYRVRESHAFSSGTYRTLEVELDAERARLTFDDRRVEVPARPVHKLFAPIWDLPSEVTESCRDGALKVVEGRRRGAWKVLLRACRAPVSIDQVERLLSRAGGTE